MAMKDLGENLFVFDAIRAKSEGIGELNARPAGVIDLEDYNYPKEVLVQVVVGEVTGSGTLDVVVESGDASADVTDNTDYVFDQIDAAGVATYHYIPTRRFINVKADVGTSDVTFSVTLVMGALGWGSSGQA